MAIFLSEQKCRACEGLVDKLKETEIQNRLMELGGGWQLESGGGGIEKQFSLKDFVTAIKFVDDLAVVAEAEDHHPDLIINYNKVTVRLSTHALNGLSLNDFILAAKIDKVFNQ